MIAWWMALLLMGTALLLGYASHHYIAMLTADESKRKAQDVLKNAKKKAEYTIKEAELQAQMKLIESRETFDREVKQRKSDLAALEDRSVQRELNLDRKVTMLDKKEHTLEAKLDKLEHDREILDAQVRDNDALKDEHRLKLQEMANLSSDEARAQLMQQLEAQSAAECGSFIRHEQEKAKETAEAKARKIVTLAIQRYAAEQVSDITASSISLPNDEMKGRIIGKEGRNIRALEAATGVDILIDDTPETVVISSFDPLRREIARLTLERLMDDGRIHPARIEEVATKVRADLEDVMQAAGEKALLELGLRGVAPQVVRTLGRLKFRTSYSQNVLKHSLETAHLMGMMASELQLDQTLAKRIGLFHDIGKAMTQDKEGSHALVGADLLRRHGEDPIVVNAVAAHHGEEPEESIYATLTVASDAMTASRPGARIDTTDIYVQRLKKLEEIATGFRGVLNCYAIQAGRELRVIVEPHRIDDNEAMQLARNISKKIEDEVQYPGQVKVTVVRETRCVEFAR